MEKMRSHYPMGGATVDLVFEHFPAFPRQDGDSWAAGILTQKGHYLLSPQLEKFTPQKSIK